MADLTVDEIRQTVREMKAIEKEHGPHVFTPADHRYIATVSTLFKEINTAYNRGLREGRERLEAESRDYYSRGDMGQ